MPASYQAFNIRTGLRVATLDGVADPVALTGVDVTEGSAVLTFAALAGGVLLFPGMVVYAQGVPAGTVLLSVDTATTGTLSVPATATVSGVLGLCLSLDLTIRSVSYAAGVYRDIWKLTKLSVGGIDMEKAGSSFTGYSLTGSAVNATGVTRYVSDEVANEPPRQKTEGWSVNRFVLSNGQIVEVPVDGNTRWTPVANA
jgi:hypothetical protein